MVERLEKPPSGHRHDCDVYDFDPDKQLGPDKPCNCGAHYHTCSCGKVFKTRQDFIDGCHDMSRKWLDKSCHTARTMVKAFVDREGSLLEQRQCRACVSMRTVVLIPALSANQARQAMRAIDGQRESFNDRHTGLELMHLWRVAKDSDWTMRPDEWTPQQVSAALLDGTKPDWEEVEGAGRPHQLHALNVTDCPCYHCAKKRLEAEEAERRGRSVEGGQ